MGKSELIKMTPLKVSNLKCLANDDIDCSVIWNAFPNIEMPFTASKNDPEEHGRLLYNEIFLGEYGVIENYSEEDRMNDEINSRLVFRNQAISKSNAIIGVLSEEREAGIISDSDLNIWKEWIKYRKNLREINLELPEIIWPNEPV